LRLTLKSPAIFRQDPALLPRLAAALDRDLPAFATSRASGRDPLFVIFEFPDRFVTLAFDSANNSLSVAAPDEGFGVRADPSIAEMLAAAAR
jgi:hypothetical protein